MLALLVLLRGGRGGSGVAVYSVRTAYSVQNTEHRTHKVCTVPWHSRRRNAKGRCQLSQIFQCTVRDGTAVEQQPSVEFGHPCRMVVAWNAHKLVLRGAAGLSNSPWGHGKLIYWMVLSAIALPMPFTVCRPFDAGLVKLHRIQIDTTDTQP